MVQQEFPSTASRSSPYFGRILQLVVVDPHCDNRSKPYPKVNATDTCKLIPSSLLLLTSPGRSREYFTPSPFCEKPFLKDGGGDDDLDFPTHFANFSLPYI